MRSLIRQTWARRPRADCVDEDVRLELLVHLKEPALDDLPRVYPGQESRNSASLPRPERDRTLFCPVPSAL